MDDQNVVVVSQKDTENFWDKRFKKDWGEGKNPDPRFLSFIEKYHKEIGPKVLDIASGEGRHLIPMAEFGYKMTGLELSKVGIEVTKQKLKDSGLKVELVKGSFREMPFELEFFDTVFSTQAFNRNDWKGAKKTFSETARVLKKDGLFFLRVKSNSIPFDKNRGEITTLINEPIDPDFPIQDRGVTFSKEREIEKGIPSKEIIHAYSLSELRSLGRKYGLVIIELPLDKKREGEKGQ
ncbi:class I SAM-dependent methyltransferase [Patescibacteria group bacterium]|nr:class I SAM-dependent methyltransferase [Patescibacteria group bacterium]